MKIILLLLLSSVALVAKDPKRAILAQHLDIIGLSVSLELPSGVGGSLRSVSFHTRLIPCEPPAMWQDGTPVSGGAVITPETMSQLLGVIDRGHFFARALTFYSDATMNPKGPPPAKENISAYFAKPKATPRAELRLTFHDSNYHTYYVIPISWTDEVVPLLTQMREVTTGLAARSLLLELLKTCRRFK